MTKPPDPQSASRRPGAFDVREVVASTSGRRVLFGAFERAVFVHDLVSGDSTQAFETTFDAGGRRLALSDEVDGIVAAAFHVHGVALYDATTGRERWRRKDLKKVQHVSLSPDGMTAYCGTDTRALVALDLRTGDTQATVRGARSLCESGWEKRVFVDAREPYVVDGAGRRICKVQRTTFAVLDVAFAPGLLCLSEVHGLTRCLALGEGEERWRYTAPEGSHVLRLGYDDTRKQFLGVQRPAVAKNRGLHLLAEVFALAEDVGQDGALRGREGDLGAAMFGADEGAGSRGADGLLGGHEGRISPELRVPVKNGFVGNHARFLAADGGSIPSLTSVPTNAQRRYR